MVSGGNDLKVKSKRLREDLQKLGLDKRLPRNNSIERCLASNADEIKTNRLLKTPTRAIIFEKDTDLIKRGERV